MDRRRFIGSLAATAGLVGGTTFGLEEYEKLQLRSHGRAVSYAAPGPAAATLFWRADTTSEIVALTFDDGPDPRYTPDVLRILERFGVVATFFMQGNHAADHPGLAREVADRHHAIGNHTYHHPDLGTATADRAHGELRRAHDALAEITGAEPTLFRPPFGRFSGGVVMAAARMSYDVALWSDHINSRDSVAENLARLRRSMQSGDVILAHDGGKLPNHTVVEALPRLLEELDERGIELVTVADLLSRSRLQQAEALAGTADEVAGDGDLSRPAQPA